MKKILFAVAAGLALAVTICSPFLTTPEAYATFTHPWSRLASGGLGSNPVTDKECGLWDNAPGSTTSGQKCAVLWIEADNGGSGGNPTENEYVTFSTTQVDVTPSTGWRVQVRFNMGSSILFRVGVQFSTSSILVQYLSTSAPTYTWRVSTFYPSTMAGRIIRVYIEINDNPDTIGSPKDWYMVLVDYIKIYSGTGTLLWQEEF